MRLDLDRSIRRVRRLARTATPREAYRAAYAFRGFGAFERILPVQTEEEICGLLELLSRQEARTACEVGCFLGGTLFMLSRVLGDDAWILAVDWPEAAEATRFPRARRKLYEAFAQRRQRIRIIFGNSQEPATVRELEAALEGRPLDFLFIDADHTLRGVTTDFRNYAPLVRPGGLIAFHDIVPNREDPKNEVWLFWRAIRPRYEVREFVAEETRRREGGHGIGVLVWDGKPITDLPADPAVCGAP